MGTITPYPLDPIDLHLGLGNLHRDLPPHFYTFVTRPSPHFDLLFYNLEP